ncbi:Ig-like domain-containing protein [Anaeromicropila herbilytica]|uniref:BIG2 domain-containing protein n=1 Tax=Anaeromicropila herbilytica TaxID=2785025 RepID=A0A7R7IBT9_9FIRM|nr:Ig-like domain-containing protein [Anaeromicropila herbilytica]BCN29988.1 hypothetical protein bsdtb5_12830 [Anaeromicropila herbilytica]
MKYNGKKILKHLLIINSMMLFLLFTSKNIAFSSEINAGESSEKAITIDTENKMNIGNFKNNTSVCYYKVTLLKDGQLKINLKSYLVNEIKVDILSSNQELLKTTTCVYDNKKQVGVLEDSSYYDAGIYYIRLQKVFADGEGKYELSTKFFNSNTIDKEPNNDITKAQKLTMQKKVTGLITFSDKSDYFYVDVTNEKNLKINIAPQFDVSFIVTILDKNGNKIESGTASYSSSSKKLVEYQFSAKNPDSRYYIYIQEVDSKNTGKYTVKTSGDVKIDSISLIPSRVSIHIGEKTKLVAYISPKNANEGYSFSSSNKSVATVSKNGTIVGKKVGKATITVKSKSGKVVSKRVVTVKCIRVKSVNLNVTNKTLKVGQKYQLKATVSPRKATNKKITWKSSHPSIAKVSSNGKVTAIKPGTATITVTSKDGSHKRQCRIKVYRPVKSVQLSSKTKTLTEGQSVRINAIVKPSNATIKAVSYHTSNSNIVSVSSKGVITAKRAGTAIITVTTKDGKKKATCKVYVKEKVVVQQPTKTSEKDDKQNTSSGKSKAKTKTDTKTVKVSDISVEGCSLSVGETKKISVSISPSNASNKKVTYKSNNSNVVTVSSNGVVKGISRGVATITVTSSDGVTSFCTVVVK